MGNGTEMEEGVSLHHRIRHQWLTRSRALEVESAELRARSLITECANIALADSLSHLKQAKEMRRHPEWLPELSELLRDAHRHTISAFESDATTDEPVPPFRRRLTVEEHTAARKEIERRSRGYPEIMGGYSGEYMDLVDELPVHGIDRVLVIHPWLERFGAYQSARAETTFAESRCATLDRDQPRSHRDNCGDNAYCQNIGDASGIVNVKNVVVSRTDSP